MISLGPCRTRCGAPARVIANTVRDPDWPVVALVEISPTEERAFVFTPDGRFAKDLEHPYDLLEETADAATRTT